MKTFSCPSCSGPLTYDEAADKVIECQFCGQSVMVPEGWRGRARIVGADEATGAARAVRGVIAVGALVACIGIGAAVYFTSQTPTPAVPATPDDTLSDALANLPPTARRMMESHAAEEEQRGFRVVWAVGDEGTGPSRFEDSRSVALDHRGHLYVAEYSGGRIQRLDTTGAFLSQWIANPEMPLRALAAGRDGTVYVLQRGIIERYQGATGEKLEPLMQSNRRYDDLFPMADGGLLAVSGLGWEQQIIRLDAQGRERLSIPIEAIRVQVAADGLGYIYALAEYRERGKHDEAIFKYDPKGQFLNRFGSTGDEPGQFKAPHAITVDGDGRVYVSDIHGIQVFGSGGRYLKTIAAGRSIFGMAFDEAGALYVMERNSHQAKKLVVDWP